MFDQSLTVFFLAIFLLSLVGQSVAGYYAFNEEQLSHDEPTLSYGRYLVGRTSAADVTENWQSEFLQFLLYVVVTVFLLSARVARVEAAGRRGSRERQGAARRRVLDTRLPRLGPGSRLAARSTPARSAS